MKVALHTLGCKLNYAETSMIGVQFLKNGFSIIDDKQKADVYIINTCTVTENAERECRQIVRRFLRQNPEAYIIVTGCYAQLRPHEISNISGLIFADFLGTNFYITTMNLSFAVPDYNLNINSANLYDSYLSSIFISISVYPISF